ncbi:VPLPA-CTERM sorting domain-containing protein [Methylomonas sp. MgM2]
MKTTKKTNNFALNSSVIAAAITMVFASSAANAIPVSASTGGTFTFSMDRDANAILAGGTVQDPGYYLAQYFDAAESDYTTLAAADFQLPAGSPEVSSVNLVHDITPVSATNPTGQANGRFVKSTTPDFSIESDTLVGTGTMGMTGVESFLGNFAGYLLTGDWSLRYSVAGRQFAWENYEVAGTPTGWYLQNNISFSAVGYDLGNLNMLVLDANNWQLTGDLLMSPENAGFLLGPALADMGNFCLGVGSYSGCTAPLTPAAVPIPAAGWLFGGGLASLLMRMRRKSALAV